MSTARLMTYAVVGLFLSRALLADDARYEGGDGHLALLTDGEADWKVLRISDAVASKGRVRTSPIGMIRIRLSDGLLLLGADTEADLDTEGRSVVLRRGRLRLIVNDATQGEWQAQCNQHVASCPAGSELAIATSTDRPAIHLLRGRARLKSANQERGSFTAPAMDLANEAKRPEPPKPPAANEWAQSIRAATERHFATAPGQLMISDLQSGNPIRLQVARLHVNVVLRPPLALVQIDQSFLNPYPVSKDGVFSINLPAGGSVCRFAATTVQRNLMEAEIFDSAQRQELYPPGIGYRPRPERTGDNTLRMHVSPVPANDSMRIVVDYTVPLVAQSGEYRFDLPLADQKTISDVTLSGTIHSPVNAPAVISVTHPDLKFAARPDNSVSFRTSQKNVAPACFSLRYPAPQDSPPMAKSYQSATDADQYFVVTVPAAMNPVKFKPSDPADVLLLVETSGHARNLARAQLAARTVAANLRAVDRLKIGCVDVTYRPLTRDWCQSNSSEVLAAIQQLQEQFPLGGSDVESTLRQSLAAFKDSATGRRQMVVYVGNGNLKEDADPILGDSSEQNANPRQPQFSAVRIGQGPVGRDWQLREAIRTGGRLFDLDEHGEPCRDLFEWTLSGMPQQVRVESVSIADVESTAVFHEDCWPAGRELVVTGQGGSRDLKVTIIADGQKLKTFAVASKPESSKDHLLFGRVWAGQKLQHMLRDPSHHKTGEGQAHIVKLCQEWSLMSPHTAFVIPESESAYDRLKIPRAIRRRYWSPPPAVTAAATPATTNPATAAAFDDAVRARVKQALEAAERALKNERPELAIQFLSGVRQRMPASERKTYNDLYERVHDQLRPAHSLAQLKLWRPLADRRTNDSLSLTIPSLLTRFSMGSCTPEFLENHPHSRQLLRIVRDCPAQIGLEQFAEFIEERTGIEVILNKAALQDEGVPFETVLFLDRVEGISVRSVLKEALGPQGLTYLLDGKILRITTQVKACETMSNIVYPVLDLIQSEPLPSPHRLANPYLDLEDAARRRIESRLKRVISADFQDTPLEEVLDVIGQKIGAQIRIDKGALQDEGITIDTQITLQLANLSAATIVTESLEPHGLTTIIENEMLKVTTQVRADEKMSSRIYSLAGLDSTSGSSLSRKNASLRWDGLVATSYLSGAGAAGGIVAQESPDQGLHANFASLSGNVLTPDSQTASAAPESIDDQILDWLPRHKPGHAVHDMISLIQQTAHGKWMEIDQEGGTINSFPLSQSLVIQQTQSVHREIEQTLAKLRRHVTNDLPWQPRTPDWKGRTQGDYLPLQQIIVAKSGKWMDIDQEGGAIVPHLPSNTLVIRQEMHVHEEISSVLTQLRRSRYLAETLQYRQTLQGIDDTSLFDLPSLTELPRHDGTVRPNRSADEIKWLASRQIPASLNQRWRSISKSTRQQRALSIRRTDTSLELGLPDRIMRAEKLRAAIAYPGLTLVEIDEWGPAVRQIADAALPWLPHRSNEELADLFDVTLVEETPQAITLRLNFPGNPDTYLQPTCSKATKMPVKWLAVAGNQLQFELKFDSKSVVAIDPKGNELERWELISDQPPIAILALQDGWGESLVVDMSVPNSPYQKARDLLQAADYEMAMRALQEALTEKPNQPLLSFLLAWCCSFTDTDAANLRLMKSCLQHVAMSDAHDLVRLVTPVNFPSAGTMSVLLSIPEDRRSAEVWTLLAETTRIAEKPQLALTFLNRALKLSSDLAATRRGKLLQVELLLQTNQLPLAIDAQKSMTDLTDSQIIYLANLFARSGEYEIADLLFERFRQQAKPAGIILAQLLGQQAEYCQQPRRRRELLLQAATLSPPQHEIRTKFLTDLFERTDGDEDARQLGELAQMQQDVSIQTRLRMRQAELLQDREQAGQIVMDLIRRDRLQHDRLTWALQILDSAEFSDDIIKLVERQLRTNAPQERRAKQILKEAYLRVGRKIDAQRAGTDTVDSPPMGDYPNVVF